MQYFVKNDGKLYGPAEIEKIKNRISDGRFSPFCTLSEDRKNWVAAQSIPELKAAIDQVLNKSEAPKEPIPKLSLHQPVPQATAQTSNTSQLKNVFAKWNKKILIISSACTVFVIALIIVIIVSQSPSHKTTKKPNVTVKHEQIQNRIADWDDEKIVKSTKFPILDSFSDVYEHYNQAVGLLTVTFEDEKGRLLELNANENFPPIPHTVEIGTVFAVGPDTFVSNSHVVFGLQDSKEKICKDYVSRIVLLAAMKAGVKNAEEYRAFVEQNRSDIQATESYFLERGIRIRSVDIRLNHSNGRKMSVRGIKRNPKYHAAQTEREVTKNSEFDISILKTDEKVECFFPMAANEELYGLKVGTEIAYLGYPMEGLSENGGIDIDNPEATFKDGTINKITDFNNVFSQPEKNRNITHDIPAAGGASGSPIFLKNGHVVAILWGINTSGFMNQSGERVGNAALQNFAIRIDCVDILCNEKVIPIDKWIK